MSGKIEYLEKYSVAPSPSRDYYGLRVFDHQVILYVWKISHGPHKLPVVRVSNFDDFTRDKQLQDEIRRVFGKYLLKHIRHITSGRENTLLTLPKCLLERLIKYLTVQDIVKLSSLSHIAKQIFDDNFVWGLLCKNYKILTKRKYGQVESVSYNWKQLFQQAQMQGLVKVPRARPATKQPKPTTKVEDSMRISNISSSAPSKLASFENQALKKQLENVRKKIVQNPIPKKPSNTYMSESTTDKEKEKFVISDKKGPVVRSLQLTTQKNTKTLKQQSSATRIESKFDVKDLLRDKPNETKPNKAQSKSHKIGARASNASLKVSEEKEISSTKSKTSGPRMTKNEKPRLVQNDQNKTRAKGKTKKIGQSKSTILNTATAFLADENLRYPVKDDSFDLADLIEASLKNMRSPRSMLDSCNFSCAQKTKSCGGDAKLYETSDKVTEHLQGLLRSGQTNVTLDRLSEKSEPLTGKSVDSVGINNTGSATTKHKPGNIESKKSGRQNKHEFDDILKLEDYFEQCYNKSIVPRAQGSGQQKRSTPRTVTDKMTLLRSLGTRNSYNKLGGINLVAEANRHELRKTLDSYRK